MTSEIGALVFTVIMAGVLIGCIVLSNRHDELRRDFAAYRAAHPAVLEQQLSTAPLAARCESCGQPLPPPDAANGKE